jgi:hypothetical protein
MKINKKNDLKFRTDCILEVLCKGGIDIFNETNRNSNYRIVGEKNSLELMFYENVGSEIYCVFCRFEKPIPNMGNPYSGKHNFYAQSDLEDAIIEFKSFLREAVKKLN